MAFAIAIFPAIALLIYIYKMDKKEKEPTKFLWKLFLRGVILVIPVIIIENIVDLPAELLFTNGSFIYALYEGFIVAACSEELGKYFFLKRKTWDSEYFDCMFDGIVYAVFVSLGFAAIENISYVMEGGLSTAIARMFSSVPGHTCFAIYMGYYYSMARLSINKGDLEACKSYKLKAKVIPILIHGTYDFLIMMEEEVVGDFITGAAYITWLVFVITLFVKAFSLVSTASKNDEYIIRHVEGWECACGRVCYGNYCPNCGHSRVVPTSIDQEVASVSYEAAGGASGSHEAAGVASVSYEAAGGAKDTASIVEEMASKDFVL